jgi:beta-xylosidase
VKHADGTFLGQAKGDPLMFDPGIFIDDDGSVYLYNGFSPKLITRIFIGGKRKLDGGYVIELEKEMVTVKVGPKLIIPRKGKSKDTGFEEHEFFEASSMRKYQGIYYFVYSSDKNHELCYATSNKPVGPFAYGGVIVSNADIGYQGRLEKNALTYHGNNHILDRHAQKNFISITMALLIRLKLQVVDLTMDL